MLCSLCQSLYLTFPVSYFILYIYLIAVALSSLLQLFQMYFGGTVQRPPILSFKPDLPGMELPLHATTEKNDQMFYKWRIKPSIPPGNTTCM